MTEAPAAHELSQVAVVIPALNEAECLSSLLPRLMALGVGQVIVGDNGSTDATRDVVAEHGATWAHQPQRGYGAACHAALQRLAEGVRIVVFMDADQHDDAPLVASLVEPIATSECDLVIGTRIADLRRAGSTTMPQRVANWLMPLLIRWGWGHKYTDLGPFRAIRRSSLEAIAMKDRAFGWTVEMQIRAVELGLRIREIPVPHPTRRLGKSKITGTLRGTILAGYWIIRTCGSLWLTKRRRREPAAPGDASSPAPDPHRESPT